MQVVTSSLVAFRKTQSRYSSMAQSILLAPYSNLLQHQPPKLYVERSFLNAQEAKVIQPFLEELGHPQPPIPIHIDSTTTVGIVNNKNKKQWSQAMEMWYF
jgi:hypothetical protein